MKIFKISSSGWEIYGQHSLIHESKTTEEFNKDCKEVFTEVFKEVTSSLEENRINIFMRAYNLLEFGIPKFLERGYKPLKFEGGYSVPGDDGSFMSNYDSQQEAVKEFGAEVVEEFVRKAKSIDNRN